MSEDQRVNPEEKEGVKGSTLEEIKNSFKENKNLFIGTAIIFVCISLSMLAGALLLNLRATTKFRNQLEPFLVQAEKISVMTEQGVTYQNFSSQYYEVKTAYNLIDYWPRSYQDEKIMFDNALEGWELTLDIWKLGIKDRNVDFDWAVGNYYNDSLVNYWSRYAGVDFSTGRAMTTKEWIGELMLRAGVYYEAGKAGVK